MSIRFSWKRRGTIKGGTEEQQKMREEERIVRQHERDIADNKNFEYQVKEVEVVMVDLPRHIHTTTCLNYNFTCHENCIYADDDQNKFVPGNGE